MAWHNCGARVTDAGPCMMDWQHVKNCHTFSLQIAATRWVDGQAVGTAIGRLHARHVNALLRLIELRGMRAETMPLLHAVQGCNATLCTSLQRQTPQLRLVDVSQCSTLLPTTYQRHADVTTTLSAAGDTYSTLH